MREQCVYMHTGFWWGNLEERDHFDDLVVYGRRIILRSIFRNRKGGRAWWTGLMWLTIGKMAGCCQHSNKSLYYIYHAF
jgi:hypothetical protein